MTPWTSFDHVFKERLDEEIKSCEKEILSGSTKRDFEAYANLTGRRHGLLMAQQMYLEELQKFDDAH